METYQALFGLKGADRVTLVIAPGGMLDSTRKAPGYLKSLSVPIQAFQGALLPAAWE